MQLFIQLDGEVRCLYGEAIELGSLGRLSVRRASHVEPSEDGRWFADLSLVEGPLLGPFDKRSDALLAEEDWLLTSWLVSG